AIDFTTNENWIKIAGTASQPNPFSGETSCMAWSPDGDNLYVGTSSGLLYRISNLGSVTDTLNGGVDYLGPTSALVVVVNPTCQVTCTLIGNFSGRDVSMIDVNPNNPDQVIVSLGNYSNTQYVYITTIATTATTAAGTFVDRTGNLDNIGGVPVFTVTFDKYVANRILVGTEHGVYETTNINPSQSAASPTWGAAMTGLDYCPVDMIRQQRWENWQVPNSGCFYIGTHGRGMWRDDSSFMPGVTGIDTPSNPNSSSGNGINHDLKVFPNPVVDNSNVVFNLTKQGDVTVQIYDLTGKIVYAKNYENLSAGTNTVQFETEEMVKGTYIITVLQGAKRVGSGRFIKMN
ncbi:MAG TPA: T9SS type A sorting domain-containing protein, partial [Bacteroidia bacterium]|nr:T9SS type A sorting domain-containing protein [Bacteroidia bacterium]